MWKSLHRRHCSDEQLLAHLDGELPVWGAKWVKRHLNACWDCRDRANELEVQTQGVAKALREDSLAEPERMEKGKLQFLTRRQEFERAFTPPSSPFLLTPQTGLMASVCAVVMLIIVGGSTPRKLKASEILARIEGEEQSLYATPLLVHQTFRLRMSQIHPESRERAGRLEIWSDAKGQRFASRWQDDSGKLRHAVWRPNPGREYVYNAKVAPTVVSLKKTLSNPTQSLADLSSSAVNLENLELGLMAWIETRQWRPLGAGSDLHSFVSQEGVILRAERDRTRICLQAERAVGSTRIEVFLELDPISYAPRLQRIRFEKSGRVMEVELIAGECEVMNSARLKVSVFEPEKTLVPSLARVVLRQPVVPTPEPREIVSSVETVDLASLEIEAHYALHRTKACLGEPFEVIPITGRNDQGHIEIRGIVETQERKKELQDALAELMLVDVNIRTAEDAVRETHRVVTDLTGSELETGIRLSGQPSVIQPALEEFFAKNKQNGGSIRQQIAGFSTQAISLSQSSLSQTWALRRLAERYGGSKKGDLLPRSRWLLEVMIRDHMAALAVENQRIRALLDPLLLQVGAKSNVQLTFSTPTNANAADWRTLSLNLLDTNKKIDTLIRVLFAASYPPEAGEVGALDDAERANKAITLIEALRRLELDLVSANEDSYKILFD